MNRETRITLSSINGIGLVSLAVLAIMATPLASYGQTKVDETVLKNLQWRSIGPAIMGGRIDDIAVVESNTSTFYVGWSADILSAQRAQRALMRRLFATCSDYPRSRSGRDLSLCHDVEHRSKLVVT